MARGGDWSATTARRAPVFIHINNNAGTSIAAAAGHAVVAAGHRIAASWVDQHGRAAPLFAVIRNPYDRVLSEYHYRRRRFRSGDSNPHLANLDRPFEAWVRATYVEGEFRTRAFFESSGVPFRDGNMADDCLIWFVSQTRWFDAADGERVVADVLRDERLDEDRAAFAAAHGIDANHGHRNSSGRAPDCWEYSTDDVRDIVRGQYADGLEAFDYGAALPVAC